MCLHTFEWPNHPYQHVNVAAYQEHVDPVFMQT